MSDKEDEYVAPVRWVGGRWMVTIPSWIAKPMNLKKDDVVRVFIKRL